MAMPMPTMSMKTAMSTNQTLPRAGERARAGFGASFMATVPVPAKGSGLRVALEHSWWRVSIPPENAGAPFEAFVTILRSGALPQVRRGDRRVLRRPHRDLHRLRAHPLDWAP